LRFSGWTKISQVAGKEQRCALRNIRLNAIHRMCRGPKRFCLRAAWTSISAFPNTLSCHEVISAHANLQRSRSLTLRPQQSLGLGSGWFLQRGDCNRCPERATEAALEQGAKRARSSDGIPGHFGQRDSSMTGGTDPEGVITSGFSDEEPHWPISLLIRAIKPL
jgi:hypothetical protein